MRRLAWFWLGLSLAAGCGGDGDGAGGGTTTQPGDTTTNGGGGGHGGSAGGGQGGQGGEAGEGGSGGATGGGGAGGEGTGGSQTGGGGSGGGGPTATPLCSGGKIASLAFEAEVVIESGASTPLSVDAGDLDGDGFPEAVTANELGDVSVLRNEGGTLAVEATLAVDKPRVVVLRDFDGDGDLDLAVAYDDGKGEEPGKTRVLFAMNDGSGAFATGDDIAVSGGAPISMEAADFSQDGDADLLVLSTGEGDAGRVHLLTNDGKGSFEPSEPATTAVGSPKCATAGDLDADDDQDVVVAGSDELGVSINQAAGPIFAPESSYPGPGAGCGALGDWNGDGKVDLAQPGCGLFTILEGDGKGVFMKANAETFGCSVAADVGDLDCDGDADMIVTDLNPVTQAGKVVVLRNEGKSGLVQKLDFEAKGGAIVTRSRVADVNGDGRPDILTAAAPGHLYAYLAK